MGMMKPAAFTYGLEDLMRRFGQTAGAGIARTQRWQLKFVARLIEKHSFPAPLPILSGGELADTPKPKSRWQMPAVDRWFEDRTPPDVLAAEDRAERQQGERTMDDRAQTLGLRMIAGGRA